MFWKEDIKGLVLSKRRKLTTILNVLDEFENKRIKEIMYDTMIKYDKNKEDPEIFTKEIDFQISNIMQNYGMLRNMFVEYYYPDAETKGYYDVYPPEDEE